MTGFTLLCQYPDLKFRNCTWRCAVCSRSTKQHYNVFQICIVGAISKATLIRCPSLTLPKHTQISLPSQTHTHTLTCTHAHRLYKSLLVFIQVVTTWKIFSYVFTDYSQMTSHYSATQRRWLLPSPERLIIFKSSQMKMVV